MNNDFSIMYTGGGQSIEYPLSTFCYPRTLDFKENEITKMWINHLESTFSKQHILFYPKRVILLIDKRFIVDNGNYSQLY